MKYLILALLLSLGPNVAYAQTNSATIQQLQQQLQALQSQIKSFSAPTASAPPAASSIPTLTRPLSKGTSGEDVKALQTFLKAQYPDIYPGPVTGFFGTVTETAVKQLQQRQGLEVVGSVGPKTINKINTLINQGAGRSGTVPTGLIKAPGLTPTTSGGGGGGGGGGGDTRPRTTTSSQTTSNTSTTTSSTSTEATTTTTYTPPSTSSSIPSPSNLTATLGYDAPTYPYVMLAWTNNSPSDTCITFEDKGWSSRDYTNRGGDCSGRNPYKMTYGTLSTLAGKTIYFRVKVLRYVDNVPTRSDPSNEVSVTFPGTAVNTGDNPPTNLTAQYRAIAQPYVYLEWTNNAKDYDCFYTERKSASNSTWSWVGTRCGGLSNGVGSTADYPALVGGEIYTYRTKDTSISGSGSETWSNEASVTIPVSQTSTSTATTTMISNQSAQAAIVDSIYSLLRQLQALIK